MKSHPQKNTLLKNAQANAESIFFKRVFFSPTQENFFCQRYFFNFFSPTHRHILQTCNDTAMNVNRFGQSVCGHRTESLRGKSKAAGNVDIYENVYLALKSR